MANLNPTNVICIQQVHLFLTSLNFLEEIKLKLHDVFEVIDFKCSILNVRRKILNATRGKTCSTKCGVEKGCCRKCLIDF